MFFTVCLNDCNCNLIWNYPLQTVFPYSRRDLEESLEVSSDEYILYLWELSDLFPDTPDII